MTNPRMTEADEAQLAEAAMRWYGWGSPVGLGVFIVCLALAGLIVAKTLGTFAGQATTGTHSELQLPGRSL